jgi:hypothetical protein
MLQSGRIRHSSSEPHHRFELAVAETVRFIAGCWLNTAADGRLSGHQNWFITGTQIGLTSVKRSSSETVPSSQNVPRRTLEQEVLPDVKAEVFLVSGD